MFVYPKEYDIIVVGAGHAGIEAALAAARMGCQTLLITMNADTVGQMSCNPAIGGTAKGQLVREIDALGGEMGKAADMTGLHFRMLNTKRGPAMWSPRAQCDKKAYGLRMKYLCEKVRGLDFRQDQVTKLISKDCQVAGVETLLGVRYYSKAVVLTTGTFLRGLMHVGFNKHQGGRWGDYAASRLSASLRKIGLNLGRFKTGTPPRLCRSSINFSKMKAQQGDFPVPFFSFWASELFHMEQSPLCASPDKLPRGFPPGSVLERNAGQMPCHLTSTTEETANIVRSNLHNSPLFSGIIEGVGPRYCPSIEDKIMRFSGKASHQIFLEPEGISTEEIYVNGLSTSLPFDVQVKLVQSITGCESATIIRPAYAVEYDFCFPTQLLPSLETKVCRNLFLAGQINGTSGYEEAAAQGIMAGINAARRIRGHNPFILNRDQAYIGVLIDDLVTKGTNEPYRMFTSRAEFRLLLRHDNADLRLSHLGREFGLLTEQQYQQVRKKREAIHAEIERLQTSRFGRDTLALILSRPGVRFEDLPDPKPNLDSETIRQVEIGIKYAGYIDRQESCVMKVKSLGTKQIPTNLDYNSILGLRTEARQKLAQIRPVTLGHASRISGVSPADVEILAVWLKRIAVLNDCEEDDSDDVESE